MATYYIDFKSGDDGNSGLTELLPWKTWANFSNTVGAGDTFKLKRGDSEFDRIINDVLYLDGDNPELPTKPKPLNMTMETYGDGEYPPVIFGNYLISDHTSWGDPVDGVYSKAWGYTPIILFEDYVPLPKHTDQYCPDGHWYAAGGTVYYNPTGTSTPLDHRISQDWEESSILSHGGGRNVLFKDLCIVGGPNLIPNFEKISYVTLDNCKFMYRTGPKFFTGYGAYNSEYITIQNCTSNYTYFSALIFQGGVTGDYYWCFDHVHIDNNHFLNHNKIPSTGEMWAVSDGDVDIIYSQGFANSIIERNEFSGFTGTGQYSFAFWNWQPDNPTISLINNIVRRNFVHDVGNGLSIGAGLTATNRNSKIYDNILINIGKDGSGAKGICIHGLNGQDSTLKGYIVNNTCYNGKIGVEIQGDYYVVKNNIMHSMDTAYINEEVGSGTHNEIDYNSYYDVSDNGNHWIGRNSYDAVNWATWKSTYTYDTNSDSLKANPLFTDAGGSLDTDYKLQSGSPCINAGVDVGLTIDYGGFSIVGNPDIGAWEYSEISYSRGAYLNLPTDDTDLTTAYSAAEVSAVETEDSVATFQGAPASYYMVHQFKMQVLGTKVTPKFHGWSSVNCVTKTMYLQIYHRTNGWETLVSDTTTAAGTHITLTYADKDVSTGYKDAGNIVSFRMQQQVPA